MLVRISFFGEVNGIPGKYNIQSPMGRILKEAKMPNEQQERLAEDLLDFLTTRIYRSNRQIRVPGPTGYRVVDEQTTDTGLGPNNEPDNKDLEDKFILDCGHAFGGSLGRCHFCDFLVCGSCIHLCSSCGLAVCNLHCVTANFDGQSKIYCRECAEQIRRSLKFQAITKTMLSFLISPDNSQSLR